MINPPLYTEHQFTTNDQPIIEHLIPDEQQMELQMSN